MPAASRIAFRPRSAHEPEPDLTGLAVTHRAIRHDLDRLVVRRGEGGERGIPGSGAIWRYTAALLAQVRAHNEDEVDILWPVAAAAAGQAVDIAPLTDDRHAVAAALTQAGQALAALRAGSGPPAHLQASVRLLRDLLEDHIADEERQLFPAIRRYLRADATGGVRSRCSAVVPCRSAGSPHHGWPATRARTSCARCEQPAAGRTGSCWPVPALGSPG